MITLISTCLMVKMFGCLEFRWTAALFTSDICMNGDINICAGDKLEQPYNSHFLGGNVVQFIGVMLHCSNHSLTGLTQS